MISRDYIYLYIYMYCVFTAASSGWTRRRRWSASASPAPTSSSPATPPSPSSPPAPGDPHWSNADWSNRVVKRGGQTPVYLKAAVKHRRSDCGLGLWRSNISGQMAVPGRRRPARPWSNAGRAWRPTPGRPPPRNMPGGPRSAPARKRGGCCRRPAS